MTPEAPIVSYRATVEVVFSTSTRAEADPGFFYIFNGKFQASRAAAQSEPEGIPGPGSPANRG